MKIKLTSMGDIKDLVARTTRADGDVLIKSGRYVVDGKSIMGICSLNFENTLEIEFSNIDDAQYLEGFRCIV